MTAQRPDSWFESASGKVFVTGVLPAVVSVVLTWVITNAASMQWTAIAAISLGVFVVTFFLFSIVRQNLRQIIWVRPIKFLFSLRLTTSAKIRASEMRTYPVDERQTDLKVPTNETPSLAEQAAMLSAAQRADSGDRKDQDARNHGTVPGNEWDPLSGDTTDLFAWHSSVNAAIIGAYLTLVSDGKSQLAQAWLGCSVEILQGFEPLRRGRGPYTVNQRKTLVFRARPHSTAHFVLIEAQLDDLRNAINEFSLGDSNTAHVDPPIWVELARPITPTTETICLEMSIALAASGKPDLIEAWKPLERAIQKGQLGWSHVGRQRVNHFMVEDADGDELQILVASLGKLASVRGLPINNWSFISRLPGPDLVRRAASSIAR